MNTLTLERLPILNPIFVPCGDRNRTSCTIVGQCEGPLGLSQTGVEDRPEAQAEIDCTQTRCDTPALCKEYGTCLPAKAPASGIALGGLAVAAAPESCPVRTVCQLPDGSLDCQRLC